MNKKFVDRIHELLQKMHGLPVQVNYEYPGLTNSSDQDQLSEDTFLNLLFETGINHELSYFKNWMTSQSLAALMDNLHFPLLLFCHSTKFSIFYPVILNKEKDQWYLYKFENENYTKENFQAAHLLIFSSGKDFKSLQNDSDDLLVITCFPNRSLFSSANEHANVPTTLQRLLKVLKSERREIGYIYIYAIISGIISLSLPLGIQSIIGFISSGEISTSVIVLISFIIIGILTTGGLQVMQLWLVEHIQQRIFTKTAFEFAFRIPKIKIESVLRYYPPELMNRFFDIVTLQKGLSKILLDCSAALLQVALGLLLLSLYHSSFIFFGMVLVLVLGLIIRLTGPKGLKTSLKESKYKYMLANWLEEIARSLSTFKLAGYSNLPLEKTDYYVSNYLYARKKHFKILIIQYLSFVGFKTLITGGLLILGCLLLVERKINIGQFVASEIIIILIMNAVEKIIIQLDTVYDVLTSIEKIGTVTDLPIEIPSGINIQKSASIHGLHLQIKQLRYKYPAEPEYILNGIDLEVKASERICLSGYSSSGKTTLINIILGFLTSYEGVVAFNNLSLRNINKNSLINLIGDNISQEDLFDGTLLENITLGSHTIPLEDVLWALECVGLSHFVQSQNQGLNTRLVNGRLGISESIARKIILARSIVGKPRMLILEDFLLGMEKETKIKLFNLLSGEEFKWTLIMVSNDEEIMQLCDRTLILKEGRVVCDGTYNNIKNNVHFKNLI